MDQKRIGAFIAQCRNEKNLTQVQITNLKPVKYLFSICANTALLVAVIELAVGFVGNFFNSNILDPMLINVSVWLILFFASMGKLTYDKENLKKRKRAGVCVDSEIEDMIPAAWIKVGNYTTCRIVCRFTYGGKEYRAVSNYYVLTPFQRKEDLYANVYIDKEDPARYSIELFRAGR